VQSEYRLKAGDNLEFVRPRGTKGLGALFTPDELMARWKIDRQRYVELLVRGLPKLEFSDGTILHPEKSIDAWFAQSFPGSQQPLAGGPMREIQAKAGSYWIHAEADEPPTGFPSGPLRGTQKELASWISHSKDPRRLRQKAMNGVIWVKMIHKRLYAAWFRTPQAYAVANQRSLSAANAPEKTMT
jgi:hypothetical protein